MAHQPQSVFKPALSNESQIYLAGSKTSKSQRSKSGQQKELTPPEMKGDDVGAGSSFRQTNQADIRPSAGVSVIPFESYQRQNTDDGICRDETSGQPARALGAVSVIPFGPYFERRRSADVDVDVRPMAPPPTLPAGDDDDRRRALDELWGIVSRLFDILQRIDPEPPQPPAP
jgi:hypothetical protein